MNEILFISIETYLSLISVLNIFIDELFRALDCSGTLDVGWHYIRGHVHSRKLIEPFRGVDLITYSQKSPATSWLRTLSQWKTPEGNKAQQGPEIINITSSNIDSDVAGNGRGSITLGGIVPTSIALHLVASSHDIQVSAML